MRVTVPTWGVTPPKRSASRLGLPKWLWRAIQIPAFSAPPLFFCMFRWLEVLTLIEAQHLVAQQFLEARNQADTL